MEVYTMTQLEMQTHLMNAYKGISKIDFVSKHCTMKVYSGSGSKAPRILNLDTEDGGDWPASRTGLNKFITGN
jgi:hypothetical protein